MEKDQEIEKDQEMGNGNGEGGLDGWILLADVDRVRLFIPIQSNRAT